MRPKFLTKLPHGTLAVLSFLLTAADPHWCLPARDFELAGLAAEVLLSQLLDGLSSSGHLCQEAFFDLHL